MTGIVWVRAYRSWRTEDERFVPPIGEEPMLVNARHIRAIEPVNRSVCRIWVYLTDHGGALYVGRDADGLAVAITIALEGAEDGSVI